MDALEAFQKYGWLGVMVVLIGKELLPFAKNFLTQERQAQLKREATEQERRAKLEERQVQAIESIAAVLPAMNARIEHLERASEATLAAVTTLVERSA